MKNNDTCKVHGTWHIITALQMRLTKMITWLPRWCQWGRTCLLMPETQETWVWSLGWEDPLEKETPTYSSILAWRGPWTEKPGGLQSMGSQRIGHDWLHTHKRIIIISIIMLLARALSVPFLKKIFTLNRSTVSTSALSFPFKNLPLPLTAATANWPRGQIAKLALLGWASEMLTPTLL